VVVTRQQTLKELGAPNMENQQLCINIDNNVNFKLKSGFTHLLPIFNGLAGEDPHTHLKEFHMVCICMKPNEVDEEQVKLKAFPFSLKRVAKGVVFLYSPRFHWNLKCYKKDFPSEVFPNISSCQHKERNMCDSAISWRDTLRVL
jgi:hypothetical protein